MVATISLNRFYTALLFLSVIPSISAQGGVGQVSFDPNLIPERIWSGDSFGMLHNGSQEGIPHFYAQNKTLKIQWFASANTNVEPAFDESEGGIQFDGDTTIIETEDTQEINAGFYVTACGRLDEDALIVAGVDKLHGYSIIQKWRFVWPQVMPPIVTDPVTGNTSVAIVLPGVVKTTLYSETFPTGGTHQYITGVIGLRSELAQNASTALVHFDSPNDLFVLDLATSQLTLLASEISTSGSLGALSSLNVKEYSRIGVRNHLNLGYIYFFGVGNPNISLNHGGAVNVDDDTVLLHLIDTNLDGIIDCAHEISTNQEGLEGAHNLNDYEEWWLE